MLHNIRLSETSEQALLQIASQRGKSPDAVLEIIAETLLGPNSSELVIAFNDGELVIHPRNVLPIRTTADVMGSDACIRDTRIAVWQLVQMKQSGFTEERILANFPGLTAADLIACWDFYAANSARVDAERRAHEDAA